MLPAPEKPERYETEFAPERCGRSLGKCPEPRGSRLKVMKLRRLYWEFEKKGKQNMAAIHTAQAPRDALVQVSMIVNGSVHALTVEPRMTLLDALRDELTLTGPKKSCDRGECR